MRDKKFFHRSGLNCLIAKDDRSNEWMCFVGFPASHSLHSVGFYKCTHAPLYKYNSIKHHTTNKIWQGLTWLGCARHPYSETKTLSLLKDIADELGEDDEDEMFGDIFDSIFI